MKILGIATCFNRKEKTVTSVKNLIEGNPNVEFHFVITDDNSKDGTREALAQIPNVTVLSGSGSLFYSGGMRMAIDWAQKQDEDYDFCLLFNDDVAFFKGTIEELAKKEKGTVWIGPTCDDKGELSYGGILKTSRWRPSVRIVKADAPEGLPCDTCNANCVLIPWDIFRGMANIDPVYTHSMGDFDIGFNLVRNGVELRVSDSYVGECCDNAVSGGWRDTTLPRKRRLQLKESPKGLPGKEWFHYLKKEYGFFTAAFFSVVPYIRIIVKW